MKMNELLEGVELLGLGPDAVLIVKLGNRRYTMQEIHQISERLKAHLPDRKILFFEHDIEIHVRPRTEA